MTDTIETMDIDSFVEEDLLGPELDVPAQEDPTPKSDLENDLSTLDTSRQEAIFLQGLDEMSTKDIWEYCSGLPLAKIEWIDDSHCNLVFSSEEEAIDAAHSLVSFPLAEDETLSTTRLRKAKTYTRSKDGVNFENLQIRCATMDDMKVQGASNYSRYYLLHGTESRRPSSRRPAQVQKTDEDGNPLPITSRLGERREDRSHKERPERSVRRTEKDVFSRLGGRILSSSGEREDRYPAWQRKQRSSHRRRSMSPVRSADPLTPERRFEDLPDSLRDRLGKKT
ncbi:hypothetical protein CLU79DRAFT_769149 [Phycomyces nitens]|nr:hypothetical protein CLU79DRAFT_769149 [Phycomyces nitens]